MRQNTIQLSIPDELRGRVTAVNFVFVNASNQIGGLESGVVAALTNAVFAVVATPVGLPVDRSDQLSAITSGLASLTVGAAKCLSTGRVRQTVVDMDGGVLLVMAGWKLAKRGRKKTVAAAIPA